MKKIALMFAIAATVFAVSSCKQNTEPKFHPTDSMTLNIPPMANQTYVLGPDAKVNLTWSQPDWGFAAVASYKVEIALAPEFVEYNILQSTYTLCNVDVPAKEIAAGINKLRGIANALDWTPEPARPVYVRIHAYINGVDQSDVYSNVITLASVVGYNEILAPGKIYLIGSPGEWVSPEESHAKQLAAWALSEPEDGIDSHIYSGTFEIPAAPAFRFYTKLEGWEVNSLGAPGGTDSDVDVDFPDAFADGAAFESNLVETKDKFHFTNWEGGKIQMTANLKDKPNTVKMVPVI